MTRSPRSCPLIPSELQIELARQAAVVVGIAAVGLVDVERVFVHRAQLAAEGEQHAAGGLACLGEHTGATTRTQAVHPGGFFGLALHLAGDDDADKAALAQQLDGLAKEQVVVQAAGMAGGVALTVGARQGIDEVRGIGNNQIEPAIGLKIPEIGTDDLDPIGPGRTGDVLGRLRGGIGIDLDCRDVEGGVALGQLEGNEARACAHIESRTCLGYRRPRAQQYAVGAHLHGAAVVAHNKLFEQK